MTNNKTLGEQTPKDENPSIPIKAQDERNPGSVTGHFMGNAVSHEQGRLTIDIAGVEESLVVSVDSSVILGRGSSDNPNDSVLDLSAYGAEEKGVSRLHARLHRTMSIIYITDLKSRNGTFLNGERLLPHQARILRDDDQVHLGKLVFQVHLR